MAMQHSRSGAVLAFLLLGATGCNVVLTTARLEPVSDERIVGEWMSVSEDGEVDPADTMSIDALGDGYVVCVAEEASDEPATRKLTLGRVGGDTIAQMEWDECADMGAGDAPCYVFARVEFADGRMVWSMLDAERLAADSLSGALRQPHVLIREVGDAGPSTRVLLKGDAERLRSTLQEYLGQEGAFAETGRAVRKR